MKRVLKAAKFMFYDSARAVVRFYIVIVAILLIALLLPLLYPRSHTEFAGMKFATTVFLFVAGLNLFKSNYLFLQANGVIRRHFYLAGLMNLVAVPVVMTAVDMVLYGLVGLLVPINQGPTYLYPSSGLADGLVWTFAANVLATTLGWLITMLYYRSGKPMKLVISLSPAILSILLPIVDLLLDGKLDQILVTFFLSAMGLSGTPNAWIGAFSMTVTAVVFAGCCFLLVRRAPVKGHEG